MSNSYQKQGSFILQTFVFLTNNFYGLPKVHKAKQINEAIQKLKNKCIEIYEFGNLTVKPIGGRPIFPTRPLSQLINIILKSFFLFNSHKKLC